jgi:glyoxylase-like metal-dependent hydrolase (beta-lactamase superfamily II)
MGELLRENVDSALDALIDNLAFALSERVDHTESLEESDRDPLVKVTDHIYKSRFSTASAWFLLSDSGKALAIDYGYHSIVSFSSWANYPRHRRPVLHGLDGLQKRFGIEKIDVVLLTHFHDDHVAGIPMLQRLFGTECWAGEPFASLVSNPESHRFPCDWPEPIAVKSLPVETPFEWEEYRFVLHSMSGHTRFSTLIEFEADGKKVIATGDQYFFMETGDGSKTFMQNHVYRNGAVLESFRESNELLRAIGPELVLPGHGDAYDVDDSLYRIFERYEAVYRELHERLLPLEGNHFEVDARAAWLTPYRRRVDSATRLEYRATVRNPSPDRADITVRLVGPGGWDSDPVTTRIAGRSEKVLTCSITPPTGTTCRRRAVALELFVDGEPFGQVAEALVTIGERFF